MVEGSRASSPAVREDFSPLPGGARDDIACVRGCKGTVYRPFRPQLGAYATRRTRSKTDITSVSGTEGPGSIPGGCRWSEFEHHPGIHRAMASGLAGPLRYDFTAPMEPDGDKPPSARDDCRPFLCPECGGGTVSTVTMVSPALDPSDPWSAVCQVLECTGCGSGIPAHLGQRWGGISFEVAQELLVARPSSRRVQTLAERAPVVKWEPCEAACFRLLALCFMVRTAV